MSRTLVHDIVKGIANVLIGQKSSTPAATAEAPAPVETPAQAPADPVAEVTAVPTEASASATEAIAPAAESTSPAPTTEVPAADLTENVATLAAVAPVGPLILEWTPEDDNKLLELRERKMAWKEIGVVLGGKHGIRERFRELCKAKSMQAGDEDKKTENSTRAEDGVNMKIDMTEGAKAERASIEGAKRPTMHFDEGEDLTMKEVGSPRGHHECGKGMELINVVR